MDCDVTVDYSIKVPVDMAASIAEKMKNGNYAMNGSSKTLQSIRTKSNDLTVGYSVRVPMDFASSVGERVGRSELELKYSSEVWNSIVATQEYHSSIGRLSRNQDTPSIPLFAAVISWEIPSLTLANSCLLIITSTVVEFQGFYKFPISQVSPISPNITLDKVQLSAPIPGSSSDEDIIIIHVHDSMEASRLVSCFPRRKINNWVPVRTPAVLTGSPIPKRDVSLIVDPADEVFDYDLSQKSSINNTDYYQQKFTHLIQQETEGRSLIQADESLEKYNNVTVEFKNINIALKERQQQQQRITTRENAVREEVRESEFDGRTVILADFKSDYQIVKAAVATHERLSPTKRLGEIIATEPRAYTIGSSIVRHAIQSESRQNPSLDPQHREAFAMGVLGYPTLPSDFSEIAQQHEMTFKIMFTRGKRCRSAFYAIAAASGDMEGFWQGVRDSVMPCIDSWEGCQGPSPILKGDETATCNNDASAEATLALHKISEFAGGGIPVIFWSAVVNPPWTIHERCVIIITDTEIHLCKKDGLAVQSYRLSSVSSFILSKSRDWIVVVFGDQRHDIIVRPIASSVNTIINTIHRLTSNTIPTTIVNEIDDYLDDNSQRIHVGPGPLTKHLLMPNVEVRIGPKNGFLEKELTAARKGIEITSDLIAAYTTSQQRQTTVFGILGNQEDQLPAIQLIQSCEIEPIKSFWNGVKSVCTAVLSEPIVDENIENGPRIDPEWKQHLNKEVAVLRKRLRQDLSTAKDTSQTVVSKQSVNDKKNGMPGVYGVRIDGVHPVEIIDDRCDLAAVITNNNISSLSHFRIPDDPDIVDIIKPLYCGSLHNTPSILYAAKVTHIGPSRSSHRVAITASNNSTDNSLYIIQGGLHRPTRVRRCVLLSTVTALYETPDNAVGIATQLTPVVVQLQNREMCRKFSLHISELTKLIAREVESVSKLYNNFYPESVVSSDSHDVVFPVSVFCQQSPKITTKTVLVPPQSYSEALSAFSAGSDRDLSSFLKNRLHEKSDNGRATEIHPAILWGTFLHNLSSELLIITSTSVTAIEIDSLRGYSIPLCSISQVIVSPTSIAIPTLSGGVDGLMASINERYPFDVNQFLDALSRACGRPIPFIEVPHESNIGVNPSKSILLPVTMLGSGEPVAVKQSVASDSPKLLPSRQHLPRTPPEERIEIPLSVAHVRTEAHVESVPFIDPSPESPKKPKKEKKEKKKKIIDKESDVDSEPETTLGALIPPPLEAVKIKKGGRIDNERKRKRRNVPIAELSLDYSESEVEGAKGFFSLLQSSANNIFQDIDNNNNNNPIDVIPEVFWIGLVTNPIPEEVTPKAKKHLQRQKYIVVVSAEHLYISNSGGRLCRCVDISSLREGYIDGKGSIGYRVNNEPDIGFKCRSSAKAAELCHAVSMLSSSTLYIRDWIPGISAVFSTEKLIKPLPVIIYTENDPIDLPVGGVGFSTKTVPSSHVRQVPLFRAPVVAAPLPICSPTPPDLPMDVLNRLVEVKQPHPSADYRVSSLTEHRPPLPLPPQPVGIIEVSDIPERPTIVTIQNPVVETSDNKYHHQQSIKVPTINGREPTPLQIINNNSKRPIPDENIKILSTNVPSGRPPHPESDVKIPPTVPLQSNNLKIPTESTRTVSKRSLPPLIDATPDLPEVSSACVQLTAEISILKLNIKEQQIVCKNLTTFARRYTDDVLLCRRSENANAILTHYESCLEVLEKSVSGELTIEIPSRIKEVHIPVIDITSNLLPDQEANETMCGLVADDGSVPVVHFLTMVTVNESGPTFLNRILALGDRVLYTITHEGAVDRCVSALSLTKIFFVYTSDKELTNVVGIKIPTAEWDFCIRLSSFTETVAFRLIVAALCPGIEIVCLDSEEELLKELNLVRPVDYHLALESDIVKMNYIPNFFRGASPQERFLTPAQVNQNSDNAHGGYYHKGGDTQVSHNSVISNQIQTAEGSPRNRKPRHTWDLETSLSSIPHGDLPDDFREFVPSDLDPIFYKDIVEVNKDDGCFAVMGRHTMVLIASSGELLHRIKLMNITKVVDKDLVMTLYLRRGDKKHISLKVSGEPEGRELSSILSTLFRHASGGDVLTITGEHDELSESVVEDSPVVSKAQVVEVPEPPLAPIEHQTESTAGSSVSSRSVSEVGFTGGLRIPDEKSDVSVINYSKRTPAIPSPLPPPAPPVTEPLVFLPSNYNLNTVNSIPPLPPHLQAGLHPTALPPSTHHPIASVANTVMMSGPNSVQFGNTSPIRRGMARMVPKLDLPPAPMSVASGIPPLAPSLRSRQSQRLSASQTPLITSSNLPPELKAFRKLLSRDGQQAMVHFIAPCLRISPGRPDEPRVTLISDKVIYQMTHQTRVNRCIQLHTVSEVIHTPTGLLAVRVPTEFDLFVRLSAASCSDAVRVIRTIVEDFGYDVHFTQLSASLHPAGLEGMLNTERPDGWVPTRGSVVPLRYIGKKLSSASKTRQSRTQSPIRSIRKSEIISAAPPPPPQPRPSSVTEVPPPPPATQNLTQAQIQDILFNDPL